MHRASTACGNPEAEHTSGLVAYLGDEPVGWVAVEPRTAYPKLRTPRVPWTGRNEDKDDAGVWSVTCFCIRKGYRVGESPTCCASRRRLRPGPRRDGGRGLRHGHPTRVEITWGELHVGAAQVFTEAGFAEVSAPTKRRRVMRINFRSDDRAVGG